MKEAFSSYFSKSVRGPPVDTRNWSLRWKAHTHSSLHSHCGYARMVFRVTEGSARSKLVHVQQRSGATPSFLRQAFLALGPAEFAPAAVFEKHRTCLP